MPRRKVEAVSNFSKEVRQDVLQFQKEMRSEISKLEKGVKEEIKKARESVKSKVAKIVKPKEPKAPKVPKAKKEMKKPETPMKAPNFELPPELMEEKKEKKKGVDQEIVKGGGDVFISVFRPYEGKRPSLGEGFFKDPDNKDLIKEAEDDIKEAMRSGKRIKTYKALVVYPKNLSDKDFKQAVKDLLLEKLGIK
jgi:hypothetical protein